MDLLALADDLTGALEVGAAFSSAGLISLVTLNQRMDLEELEESVRVLVIDTESRHLSAAESYGVVHVLAAAAHGRGVRRLFKKTDSTLRGNIASELAALVDACPDSPMVYAPAYPRMGRTVRDGMLFVDGIPVGDSSFSLDELNPIRESSIPALFNAGDLPVPILSVRPEMLHESLPPGIYILDGKDEEDVRMAARFFAASRRFRLAAGPAGFAHSLADVLSPPGPGPAGWPGIESCLVVNGSRHPVSLAQVQHARSAGWPAVHPAGVCEALAQCGWVILDHPPMEAEAGLDFAARLGRLVGDIVLETEVDALAVFGGDTACGILGALECTRLRPLGDVLPGVPLSRIEPGTMKRRRNARKSGFSIVTKAGGFGTPDLLIRLRDKLLLC